MFVDPRVFDFMAKFILLSLFEECRSTGAWAWYRGLRSSPHLIDFIWVLPKLADGFWFWVGKLHSSILSQWGNWRNSFDWLSSWGRLEFTYFSSCMLNPLSRLIKLEFWFIPPYSKWEININNFDKPKPGVNSINNNEHLGIWSEYDCP